jgi:multidrug efflux pump subunit AcrB
VPIGAPLTQTESVMQRIEQAVHAQPEVKTVSAIVGQQMNVDLGVPDANATHVGQMFIELTPVESRDRESARVVDAIRAAMGNIDEAESIRFSEIGGAGGGPDITIRVAGSHDKQVTECVDRIKRLLGEFEGVHDIADDNFDSQRELQIVLRPGAATLGFTVQDVARQVRGALYGLEPHVFSADREDIKIRVRLNEESRRSLGTIESLWVINPAGNRVPLSEVAELVDGRGYSSIRRIDRERAITISADTSESTNPELIVQEITPHLNELRAQHQQVDIEFAGRQRDLADAFSTLPIAFIAAIVLIYLILATLFSSYVQPLVVMVAIPFAIVGVVWGHLLLGYKLTFLSLIGFVALTGVVVNNSLILIDFYNTKRAAGAPLRDALISAGRDRLRPIVLTSVTTFFGLAPLVFERSFQAKFLIPMAISISFGLISSTVLVLTVLPCFMVIVDDIKAALHYLWHGLPRAELQVETEPMLPEPD